MKLEIKKHHNPIFALGAVVNLFFEDQMFGQHRLNAFVAHVLGQIMQDHYVFCVDGNEIVGYAGWALCNQDVAEKWLNQQYQPTHQECQEGDCVLILYFYGKSNQVTKQQTDYLRQLYPGKIFYLIRQKPNGVTTRHRLKNLKASP